MLSPLRIVCGARLPGSTSLIMLGQRLLRSLSTVAHTLMNSLKRVKPKVIIPVGNVALRRICNVSGINAHQCYVHDTPYGIPAVPTFHPSFVMQDNFKYTPVVLFAFRKALEIAKSGSFQRTPTDYCLDASLPEMEAWMERLATHLTCHWQ